MGQETFTNIKIRKADINVGLQSFGQVLQECNNEVYANNLTIYMQ